MSVKATRTRTTQTSIDRSSSEVAVSLPTLVALAVVAFVLIDARSRHGIGTALIAAAAVIVALITVLAVILGIHLQRAARQHHATQVTRSTIAIATDLAAARQHQADTRSLQIASRPNPFPLGTTEWQHFETARIASLRHHLEIGPGPTYRRGFPL